MNAIKATPKSSWAILIVALIVVGTLIVYFGAWVGAIFLCAVAVLGGMAMFLKSKDIVLRISGLIFLGIGLLFLFLLPAWLTSFHFQSGATDAVESQPTETPASTQEPFRQQEPLRVPVKYPVSVDKHITVEVTSAKVGIPFVEIGICYTTLDGGEWYPWPGELIYGEYEIYISEVEFMEGEKYASSTSTGVRCAHLRYLIDDVDSVTLPMEFSIKEFYAPGREINSPCQEIQQRWRTNPMAQEYGIKISCKDGFTEGPTVTLDDYSKSVSREDVQWVFDMLTTAEVPGHWEFFITEIEP